MAAWPAPPTDAISRRQGKKFCPSFLLVVTEGFVWGVGGYPGRGLPGRELAHEAIFNSGYSDHCPSSTPYFRRPGLKQGHKDIPGCGSTSLWPQTGTIEANNSSQNSYQVLRSCPASAEGTTVLPFACASALENPGWGPGAPWAASG